MERPLRIGLHFWELPVSDWAARVRRYEALGFATVTFTDHVVVPQWEPMTALAAVAAATSRIGLGTLVLDTGLRDPVLTAKAAATVARLGPGRFELGLGAGYVAANFAASGVPFAPAGQRIERLGEFVALVRQLCTEPSTTFRGTHFAVEGSPMVAPEPVTLRILVGGGGPKLLHLAGQVADTVSVIPRQSTGDWSVRESMGDSTVERLRQKVTWARRGAEAAGRDPHALGLHTMVVKTIVDPDPAPLIAREAAETGVTAEDMAASSLYLCGTPDQLVEELVRWRRETGISSFALFDPGEDQITALAEGVLAPLQGA